MPVAANPIPRHCDVRIVYGFGYNAREKDYEIIQIMSYRNSGDEFAHKSQICVYSLAKNSWGRIEKTNPYIIESEGIGELVNDVLHWVGKNCANPHHKPNLVIAYDIENKKLREVVLPEYEGENMLMIHVAVLYGCLSLICEYSRVVEAWVMKEYDVKDSWTKVFKIIEQPVYDVSMTNVVPLCFVMKCARLIRMVRNRDQFLGQIGGSVAKNLVEQYYPTATYIESIITL